MPTSLSLPRTLAPSASFTLHPAAVSACLFPSLLPLHSLLLSRFTRVHLPSLNAFLLLSYFLFFRFSIDPQSDPEALFRITPDTGLITTAMELDRERDHWHNITVIATQRGQICFFAHDVFRVSSLHLVFYLELKLINEIHVLPPLAPAPSKERKRFKGVQTVYGAMSEKYSIQCDAVQ